MTPEQQNALNLLKTYTAGRFEIWSLAGSAKATARAHIMSVLRGHRVPQSKAGVIAIRDAFYEIAKPSGTCEAMREESFYAWCHLNTAA